MFGNQPVFPMKKYPSVEITGEMIQAARKLTKTVRVNRTVASPIDTLTGILGEFVFAKYFYGDWRNHQVGANRGKTDFPDIEIKTSAFPFNENLNLLVREDYARKRKPAFYVQIILDTPDPSGVKVSAGTLAYLCGFAGAEEVDAAPKKDFGSKFGGSGGYLCHYIPVKKLRPMEKFKQMYHQREAKIEMFEGKRRSDDFYYMGNLALLDENPLAVFCSRSIPEIALHPILQFGKALLKLPLTFAGGWQSPVEKQLLKKRPPGAASKIIYFLAQGFGQFKTPAALSEDLKSGNILFISLWKDQQHINRNLVKKRNEFILRKIPRFLFLGLSKGGNLDQLFHWAQLKNTDVYLFDHPVNRDWMKTGITGVSEKHISQLVSM